MKRLFFPVTTKLVALTSLVIGVLSLSIFVIVPAMMEKQELRAITDSSQVTGRMLAYSVSSALVFEDRSFAREVLQSAGQDPGILFAVVYDSKGDVFAQFRREGSPDPPSKSAEGTKALFPHFSRLDVRSPVFHNGQIIGSVLTDFSLQGVRADVSRGRKTIAGLSVLLFVLGTAAAYAVSAYVVRPLHMLSRTAEEIAAGNRAKRTTVRSHDEIGVLSASFNRMVESLEAAYRELEKTNRELEGHVERRTQELRDEVQQRRRAEEALKESERRYRNLFEEDFSASFLCLPDGTLLACNPAFVRIFGFRSVSEAMARTFASLFPKADDHAEWLSRLRTQGRLRNDEMELRRNDGSPILVLGNIVGILDEKNQLREIQGYLLDTTERRSLEVQLRQAQKMEAVGRLAGGVAHDFNNLLTAILGFSDLLLDRLGASSDLRPYVEEVHKAGERAAALTRQLLAFSRRQVLEPTVLDLNVVVYNMEAMLRRVIGEDVDLVADLAPDLAHVKADSGQLEQVVMNLAVNARDAMPQGGKLILKTSNVELDETVVLKNVAMIAGSYVLLTVSDTGIGMDPVTQSHLFEPFYTTKDQGKGTGLGLATVYGIVKQSGGYIWARSELGHGATFEVYLPRFDAPVETMESSSKRKAASTGSETVLLVEDDDAVRKLVRSTLDASGYTVLEARDGAEALRVVEAKQAVSLLLSDVVMPGMSGPELARRVEGIQPGVKVLLMSGYTEAHLAGQIAWEPVWALLQKPFSPAALTQKVRQELDRR